MAIQLAPARTGNAQRLARMVQLPTVRTKGDEPFNAFVALLATEYPLVHENLSLETVTERGLLYTWKGTSSERPVVLMAHYDVVPVEAEGWHDDPFGGQIRNGAVWGRGTLDDKGPLLVIIEAVENLLAAGFVPAHDVYLSFGGDEETYGGGAVAIAKLLQDRGIEPWLVIDEGGAVVDSPISFVSVTAAMVGVGEKGVASVRLTVAGTGGHASAPPARSTAGRLARAIRRLEKNPFAARMPRPFRQMLAAFEPHVGAQDRVGLWLLRTLHRPAALMFARRGGEPAALVQTTIAMTMLEGGTAANVLPTALSVVLNIRVAQGETIDSVVATLRKRIADDAVAIEVIDSSAPSPLSATDNEQFALIRAAVDSTYPEAVTAPYVMMAATDSRHFHRFSPAVYRFSPLAMTAEQRASIHGPNEFVTVDSLDRGERFFQVLLRSL